MSITLLVPLSIRRFNGVFAAVDAEDEDIVAPHNWHLCSGHYAARVRLRSEEPGPRIILMHRELLGFPEGFEVDHADSDGLNNRRCNIRIATRGQNTANSSPRRKNTSGYRGVARVTGSKTWLARITTGGRSYHLGTFATPQEAAIAYDEAATEIYGAFARLNNAILS
jgi:hypothetical protein